MPLAPKSKVFKQKNAIPEESRPPLYLVVDQDTDKVKRRKSSPGKKRSNRLATLVSFALVVVLLGPLMVNLHHCYILNLELIEKKEEYARLLDIQEQLKKELDYMVTPEAIEKLARERLGMAFPYETLVRQAIAQEVLPQFGQVKTGSVTH